MTEETTGGTSALNHLNQHTDSQMQPEGNPLTKEDASFAQTQITLQETAHKTQGTENTATTTPMAHTPKMSASDTAKVNGTSNTKKSPHQKTVTRKTRDG